MSTTTQPNDKPKRRKAEPIDIDAALARLILLRRFHELPRPLKYDIAYDSPNTAEGIYLKLVTPSDLLAWAKALGIPEHRYGSQVSPDGSEIHVTWRDGWHGWYVNLTCYFEPGGSTSSALDADTVAGLEDIAGPAEAVSA